MNKEKSVTVEELAISNMVEIQALIRILERRGITSENEILEEIKILKKEMDDNIKANSKLN